MADATFKWLPAVPEPGEEGETEENADATPSADFQLRNISLSIPNGALVAVVGPTLSAPSVAISLRFRWRCSVAEERIAAIIWPHKRLVPKIPAISECDGNR